MEQQEGVITNEKQQKEYTKKNLIFDIIFFGVLILCVLLVPKYVMQRTIVEGSSMESTLHDGNNLIVEKLSYRFDKLERFDIIVFYPYGRENKDYYIKRIIGLPGETIQIIEDNIYINGELLEEDYGKDAMAYAGIAALPYELADDEYFVLGDNRNNSTDSRKASLGPVKKENIGGRAILRIWPLKEFGSIK